MRRRPLRRRWLRRGRGRRGCRGRCRRRGTSGRCRGPGRRRRRCPPARRGGRSGCGSRRAGRGRRTPPWRAARLRRGRPRCGRSRRPAGTARLAASAPASTRRRARAANSGVIQLKKTPSNSAPARAHIFGPIAASTRRTPGSRSRSSGNDSRIAVNGLSEKPAPTPSQSRAGSSPVASRSAAICSGGVRSSAITATPRSICGAAGANSASVSSPLAPGWSFDQTEA